MFGTSFPNKLNFFIKLEFAWLPLLIERETIWAFRFNRLELSEHDKYLRLALDKPNISQHSWTKHLPCPARWATSKHANCPNQTTVKFKFNSAGLKERRWPLGKQHFQMSWRHSSQQSYPEAIPTSDSEHVSHCAFNILRNSNSKSKCFLKFSFRNKENAVGKEEQF